MAELGPTTTSDSCISQQFQKEPLVVVTKTAPKQMTRDQLMEMFTEIGDVGRVELKMTVPPAQRGAMTKLHIDLLDGKLREVYFFDTPDLKLWSVGVAVRARRTQGADDDTVVKLRPIHVQDLSPEVRESPNLKVEMDITRGSYVVSASLKGKSAAGDVKATLGGDRPLEKLFSKEQRAFFAEHAPEGVAWTDLVALGPSFVTVLKMTPPDFARKLTIEQWHYPGEAPLVEISAKATPEGVLILAAEARAYLNSIGLSATGPQEPKTRKALEFYASRYEVSA